jgi:sortase A
MTRVVRATGSLLITCGLLVLLFVAYDLWGTSIGTRAAQHRLDRELQHAWGGSVSSAAGPLAGPALRLRDGAPFAILTIPRLGSHYRQVLVQGVGVADLQEGPGHYPGSATPGQIGNFAVAGHRTTYGAPFADLNLLRAGDEVDVQVRDTIYLYRVTGLEIVRPENVGVVAPVPDHPGARPRRAMLTFTTCHPKYSAEKRLIVHAALDRVEQAADRGAA